MLIQKLGFIARRARGARLIGSGRLDFFVLISGIEGVYSLFVRLPLGGFLVDVEHNLDNGIARTVNLSLVASSSASGKAASHNRGYGKH